MKPMNPLFMGVITSIRRKVPKLCRMSSFYRLAVKAFQKRHGIKTAAFSVSQVKLQNLGRGTSNDGLTYT